MTDLEVLLSAVTGIAERDLDLSETSGVYAALAEFFAHGLASNGQVFVMVCP